MKVELANRHDEMTHEGYDVRRSTTEGEEYEACQ